VLLTANAALFDPARAAERNAGNFYPVRSDQRRLQPALYAFAAATPRPPAIFFTLVAYADATGSRPTFALPPDELARHAPSVQPAADFRAETLAAILGTPIARLHQVRHRHLLEDDLS